MKKTKWMRVLLVCGALICLCCGAVAIRWLLHNVPAWVWLGLFAWSIGAIVTYRIQAAVQKAEKEKRLSKCRNYLSKRNL